MTKRRQTYEASGITVTFDVVAHQIERCPSGALQYVRKPKAD